MPLPHRNASERHAARTTPGAGVDGEVQVAGAVPAPDQSVTQRDYHDARTRATRRDQRGQRD
jgi:hypothetical protein